MAAKPVLIYDGDCQFCAYWANYWQKLTGDEVEYKPYQEVAQQYPDISLFAFQHAVQYIACDGKIASAAEASFLTLSHARGRRYWLTLYRKLPGFAYLTEKAYALIAAHRSLFYRISLLLWGRNYEPPRYDLLIWLFLRGLGLIYLSAFISFGVQASGLIGSQGILPITDLISAAQQQVGLERYWRWPMLFWLNASDIMIQLACWLGAICSLCLIVNILPRINLILMYLLYLSLVNAGQVFMTFQWDSYILETGLIAIFLYDTPRLAIWLLRWLLFRFIFSGGMVKLMSGDLTWTNLTALDYHFLTQPLPTPLAWYAHQLPSSMLHMATLATLFIELVMPFFIFFPRHLRFMAGYAILLLQTVILVTGNYNFFNLLTLLLCLVLFDDAALRCIMPLRFTRFLSSQINRIRPYHFMRIIAGLFAIVTLCLSVIQLQLRFIGQSPQLLARMYYYAEPLRLVNPYGPFAVMTTQRMEIIIEGSNDEMEWHAYEFKYKPGDIYRRPLWNIPHQPRLDWQMWFAALGSANENPWLLSFIQRLLQNSPPVLALLETNPFPQQPPKYIRAQFYQYNFTTYQEREKSGAWWKRERLWLYLPSVHLILRQ